MYITPYYRNNISSLFSQFDRIFENAFEAAAQPAYATLNVYETEGSYLANIDAPGFSKDAFDIDVDRSIVRVSAETKSDDSAARKLSRAFRVPESVDTANISARYQDGVLALELPKKPESVAQKITVK